MSEKNHKEMGKIIRLDGLMCPICKQKKTIKPIRFTEPQTRLSLIILFCQSCGYPFIKKQGGDK